MIEKMEWFNFKYESVLTRCIRDRGMQLNVHNMLVPDMKQHDYNEWTNGRAEKNQNECSKLVVDKLVKLY